MENSEKGTATEFGLKILQKLYPKIAPRAAQIQPHQTLLEEEKFSNKEIDYILKKIPNGKAPGYDDIDNIIVKVIFNSFPSLLLDFFNKCLELKCFPDPLKIGLVILFNKTGKEEQSIKSYRPISLLPTLGKLLEKLLLQRFNFQLKTKNSNIHCSTDLEKGSQLTTHSCMSDLAYNKLEGRKNTLCRYL
ncbi:hypothetical protein AVEN_85334-1 [Araneus ventricosus]|uniref:Reverse transcriptase domain-containing protein n=1 Tax=Araneus ventricosus TaxID=182803 RepID=A0A4Y2DXP7_ARAVE|nr:hypothetical protein AVEN_85334-1 [Araneus ventricosus]